MCNFLKTAVKVLRMAIIAVICASVLLLLAIMALGLKLYAVIDPSMDEYPIGSLIYVKEVDVDSLNAGDVITFRLSDNLVVTHRIYETILNPETNERVFITKGDSSEEVDPGLISKESIVGVPSAVIPKLGDAVTYIKYPPGSYISITVCIIMVSFVFFSDNIISLIDKKNKKEQ